MKTRIILVIICLIVWQTSWAQTATISGSVLSEGTPIPFASIGLAKTSFGATTDSAGHFIIQDLPFGDYTIMATFTGYIPERQKISIHAPEISLSFELKESTQALGEVVVSGTMVEVSKTDSPVPVDVYTKDFFKANPTPSIFESLQNVNGVRPQLNCNVCNTGDIHINGLEGPYTMVLIDGMPIVSGLSTVYGLTGIPQSMIERVEIVKGPASTLYGSEAVGGLINIITSKPTQSPRVAVNIFGTDWGEVNTDLGISYKVSDQVHGLVGINYFNYQNPIDQNGDNFTDITLQDRISIFNKYSFERKQNRVLSLAGRYVYEDRWGGEMDWSRAYRGGRERYGESIFTSRWEILGAYQLPVSENINFQFSANGHHQNSVYGDTWYIADQRIGFGQLTWQKETGIHGLLAGMAYRYTYYDDNTPATLSENGQRNMPSVIHLPGVFLQDQLQLGDNHQLLLGMRYDYNSAHGSILTPRINYKWNSNDKLNTLRISGGNGYRVANIFTEDHAALTGARQVVIDGTISPETSWNANINYVKKIFTQNGTYIGLDATAFYTYFTNRILPDYETNPNQIIYSNLAGSSISQGISANADIVFENGLKILAGATLMDVSVTEEGESFRQLLTESFQGVWTISYTIAKAGLQIDYTGNLYGPMRLPLLGPLDDRPAWSPWWSIQNIQLTKTLGNRWEIYGGVKNLLNFTPPANSIARAFDPFDQSVTFGTDGQPVPTANNPNALTFDPSYVFAPNQGIRSFLGLRYTWK